MQAVQIKKPGGIDEMFLGDEKDPITGPFDLLIKVHATAVNRGDILQRKGFYPPPEGASNILGLEIAGSVEKIGKKCSGFEIGDRVFSIVPGGGYAEYASLDHRLAMKIPQNLSYEEAAAVPEAFLTAYQSLFLLGAFKKSERVLIHAGASGVGSAAIQLVRCFKGVSMVTVSSDEKIAFCKELGANYAISYKEKDFAGEVMALTEKKGADIIIDFIGAKYFEKNMRCIAQDGRLVLLAIMGGRVVESVDLSTILLKRVKLMGSTLRGRSIDYKANLTEQFSSNCLEHFETGILKPSIYQSMPLSKVKEAHAIIESNQNMGKIVLTVS